MLTSFGVAAVSSLQCGPVEFLAQRTRRAPRRVGSAHRDELAVDGSRP
jgi:hypothetical protein